MFLSRIFRDTLLLIALLLSISSVRAQEPPPAPRFDRIVYDSPDRYRMLLPALGDEKRIREIAAPLKKETDEDTLAAIAAWIQAHVKYDETAAYAWRNCDAILKTGVYGGCADHALLFGALARACGIPAVWVKTMDYDWIREFRATGTCQSWRGHVFLEIFSEKKWKLLDATMMQLYDDYSPESRHMPGGRWAYDKGDDPQALVLSLDWERWKQQTAAYYKDFDLSQLPMPQGRTPGIPKNGVYIAADSPFYERVAARVRSLGLPMMMSFNGSFERYLAQAKGRYLVVTAVGDRIVLPAEYHARYLPVTPEELREKRKTAAQGTLRRTLPDGTRIVLVYGTTQEDIFREIEQLKLEPDTAKP